MSLYFSVSSGLKSIIGSDLIQDDFIAVFELVKNSYDAHATLVTITFEEDKITIRDDGKGMDYDDITNKWLQVAYSAKKEGEEDDELGGKEFDGYRDKIVPSKYYAGAKGIGRFSSDRLGRNLLLTTRKATRKSTVEQLSINWKDFEKDPHKRFETVSVNRITEPDVSAYPKFANGTVLEITNLRSTWPRKKLQDLKRSLEKLVNPFEAGNEKRESRVSKARKFNIELVVERENSNDTKEAYPRDYVNGLVKNFVLETLNIKTTQLYTEISRDGKFITTELIDRGRLVYRIREYNSFSELNDIRIQLYYLNRAAKNNFTRMMGIPSVQFGSVFVYKNGFRIYPYGEEGVDSFEIDRRKQQGYNRYLGTRDITGQIEIFGNDEKFQETSSRDGGLKQTAAYYELVELFLKKCFYRLERYVVDVQWFLKDVYNEDTSAIEHSQQAKNRVLSLINRLVDSNEVVLEEYGKDFLDIMQEKMDDNDDVPIALDALERLGDKTGDRDFVKQIKNARREYKVLKEKNEEAVRKAQEEATKAAEAAEAQRKAELELELERERTTYLVATRKLSSDAEGLIHNIVITTKIISANVDGLIEMILEGDYKKDELLKKLSTIKYNSDKAQKISKLITRANFKTQAEKQNTDIAMYTQQYLGFYSEIYEKKDLTLTVNNLDATLTKKVNILEFSMILDNLISNSQKANSTEIVVDIVNDDSGNLIILFSDNGNGLDKKFHGSESRIFDLGITTTDGSGIGLDHVRQGLRKIRGEIKYIGVGINGEGAMFEIVIKK